MGSIAKLYNNRLYIYVTPITLQDSHPSFLFIINTCFELHFIASVCHSFITINDCFMLKLYASIFLLILISSCRTSVNYIGQSLPSTNNTIDVFVDASTIGKSYTIIGKGYIDYNLRLNHEKMQM